MACKLGIGRHPVERHVVHLVEEFGGVAVVDHQPGQGRAVLSSQPRCWVRASSRGQAGDLDHELGDPLAISSINSVSAG
jgi:predicted ArsR family transcriptional regulator